MSYQQPAQPPSPGQGFQPEAKQSPWKTPKSKIFWPMVIAAVVLWSVAAFIVFSTVYQSMGRGIARIILIGLGAALVYGVRSVEASQRRKELSSQAPSPVAAPGTPGAQPYGQAPAYGQAPQGVADPGRQWPQQPTAPGQQPGYGQGTAGHGQQPPTIQPGQQQGYGQQG